MKTPRRAMNGVACLLVVLGGINGINAQLPSHHHGGSFHVSFTSEGPGRKLADRETPRRPVGEAAYGFNKLVSAQRLPTYPLVPPSLHKLHHCAACFRPLPRRFR